MTARLKGKVAVVTGGANGMGAAQAAMMAREGAKVCIMDVRDDLAAPVLERILDADGEAMFHRGDVTREADWEEVLAAVVARYGRLDILVNNAGIGANRLDPDSVDDWKTVMEINVMGAAIGTRLAVPIMRAGGGGAIVNISSIAAFAAFEDANPVYATSKGALWTYTRQAALTHAKDGIRVNSIHPGLMPRMLQPGNPALSDAEQGRADKLGHVPLRRLGHPDEVAYGVVFLASDEASYVTGSSLVIDGGYLLK
ncbi:SDR family NAD(P)-dependent oxidoreductase [Sinisalibacter aestuarii]|uniref:Short-chain dehydrogenase n=1 Tax=Sinisalibacter aestuarii TaxID=2949426 RepID=A0ABQ5LPX1_9RHOB|nr:glucose 1-dehydrogenase [Sinisalibacter aestuarii]GKY87042.1 short-chain dehydrogenase [Sinisalibacter aestuarii]